MFSDFFHTIANMVKQAELAPSPEQHGPRAIAEWSRPKEPTPEYKSPGVAAGARAGQPMPPDHGWVPLGAGQTRLNENSRTKVEDGKTYLWVEPPEQTETDRYTEQKQRYADRMKRLDDLGIADELGMKAGALTTVELPHTERMSRREYNHLPDDERAAIDFNTLLAAAVKRDVRHQDDYKPSKMERMNYDESMKQMFGEGRGSDVGLYAPETMALLQQLDIRDKGHDLDDYLGLKVAITADDLKNFDTGGSAPGALIEGRVPEGTRDRALYQQHLVDATQEALSGAIKRGSRMLQDFRTTMRSDPFFHSHVHDMGGIYHRPADGISGFGGESLDRNISASFDELMAGTPQEIKSGMAKLRSSLPPDKVEAFLNYADTELRNAEQYDLQLGDKSRSPEKMRKLLGLSG